MKRALLSVLAAIAALYPGFLLGYTLGPWAADLVRVRGQFNPIGVLSFLASMVLVPLVLSAVVGVVVWRATTPVVKKDSPL